MPEEVQAAKDKLDNLYRLPDVARIVREEDSMREGAVQALISLFPAEESSDTRQTFASQCIRMLIEVELKRFGKVTRTYAFSSFPLP
ncbi:hypothetical protein KGQ71_01590 [Patescibacteria group bacterium]|nr:hypothetical protein [Patescibacteria group bacterium]